MTHYVAAWTNESTDTWDLIIAEDGHFSGTDPNAHVVAEYHSSAPVTGDYPGDDYLTERGWNLISPGFPWAESSNAFYHDVAPAGVVECRECGRRSDDEEAQS